jgi:hypothetical protein
MTRAWRTVMVRLKNCTGALALDGSTAIAAPAGCAPNVAAAGADGSCAVVQDGTRSKQTAVKIEKMRRKAESCFGNAITHEPLYDSRSTLVI